MLNEIFKKYKKSSNEVYNEDLKNEELDESKSENEIKNNNYKNNKNEDFLNENEMLNIKKKTNEIMSKYCTLYNKNN